VAVPRHARNHAMRASPTVISRRNFNPTTCGTSGGAATSSIITAAKAGQLSQTLRRLGVVRRHRESVQLSAAGSISASSS
jgi:hypothetical protein